mmetsp:Transcript_46591/g.141132  ORF Transcript_46591/g.141132 Transcript_46591/m.141132 type:complete len:214 (-) Transcript_46591:57-698(-)
MRPRCAPAHAVQTKHPIASLCAAARITPARGEGGARIDAQRGNFSEQSAHSWFSGRSSRSRTLRFNASSGVCGSFLPSLPLLSPTTAMASSVKSMWADAGSKITVDSSSSSHSLWRAPFPLAPRKRISGEAGTPEEDDDAGRPPRRRIESLADENEKERMELSTFAKNPPPAPLPPLAEGTSSSLCVAYADREEVCRRCPWVGRCPRHPPRQK